MNTTPSGLRYEELTEGTLSLDLPGLDVLVADMLMTEQPPA